MGDERCRWCGEPQHKNSLNGNTLGLYCPMVRAFGFDANGTIIRVEYLTPADCVPVRLDPEEPAGDYPRLSR